MMPQDVLALLKLQAHPELRQIRDLAEGLGYDIAGTRRSVARLRAVGLYDVPGPGMVPLGAAEEFLVHAVRYVFPAVRGGATTGVPTSWAAEPLRSAVSVDDSPPVWPDADGQTTGEALQPLHAIALSAVAGDELETRSIAIRLLKAELRSR